MWKANGKRSIYWKCSTLEIHIVNFKNPYFVFACLYSFLNIYYKYITYQFSIPPLIKKRLLDIREISNHPIIKTLSFGTQE